MLSDSKVSTEVFLSECCHGTPQVPCPLHLSLLGDRIAVQCWSPGPEGRDRQPEGLLRDRMTSPRHLLPGKLGFRIVLLSRRVLSRRRKRGGFKKGFPIGRASRREPRLKRLEGHRRLNSRCPFKKRLPWRRSPENSCPH